MQCVRGKKVNKNNMIVKIHKKEEKTIIAVCDKELVGKRIEEGDKQLDLSSDFYNGEEIKDTMEIGDLLRNADIINLVGERSIKIGLDEGLIDKKSIIRIKNIPHAQAIVSNEN